MRAVVDCGETDRGDVREETVEESQAAICKQGDTAESCVRGGATTIAFLFPHAGIGS